MVLDTQTVDGGDAPQLLRREVNERIREIIRGWESSSIEVLCECTARRCGELLLVDCPTYDAVRSSPAQFLVKAGHRTDGAERLVAEHDGYLVVERAGGDV